MYQILFRTHSGLRYLVLLMLVVVIVKSLMGLIGKKPFEKTDNLLSLVLLISTHIQFLVGLILYFLSPAVKLGEGAMSDSYRYWTVEHVTMMLLAVVLITVGRSTSKKLTEPAAKHKRLFLLNAIALLIIIAAILMSGRKLFGS
jgi:hypothetical protein